MILPVIETSRDYAIGFFDMSVKPQVLLMFMSLDLKPDGVPEWIDRWHACCSARAVTPHLYAVGINADEK